MGRWFMAALIAVLALTLPSGAAAQEEDEDEADDVLIRINQAVRIGRDERVGTLVVINDDAVVLGRVDASVVVINGNAEIAGPVEGSVFVLNGDVVLRSEARVGGDVAAANGDVERAPDAVVEGEISEGAADIRFGWALALFSILTWLGTALLVILAGLLFAAIGGRQLSSATDVITGRFGPAVLVTLVLWLAVPIAAVVLFFTIVGIPLGLAVLIFLLPALWFLGYLVGGTWLGGLILRGFGRPRREEHPYLSAVVGLLVLQIGLLVPFIGPLAVLLLGLIGSGALVIVAWRAWGGAAARPTAPAPTAGS